MCELTRGEDILWRYVFLGKLVHGTYVNKVVKKYENFWESIYWRIPFIVGYVCPESYVKTFDIVYWIECV